MIQFRAAWLIAPLVGWAITSTPALAAVFADFDPGRHNRFLTGTDPNPAFFLDESLISGVALNRATLITPKHYLAARHASTSMPMFRGSDGVVRSYATSTSTTLMTTLPDNTTAASDMLLFTLSDPIPTSHGVRPLPLIDSTAGALIGREFVVMGQSNQAGRNVVDDVVLVTFSGGASPTEAIQYSFDTAANGGTGGLGDDEAGLIAGDSGHPALLRLGDDLALIGTHYGIDISEGQDPAAGDRYDSFSTWVTPYLDQIRAVTLADGFDIETLGVSSVPEPSNIPLLIACGIVSVALVRRKKQSRIAVRESCAAARGSCDTPPSPTRTLPRHCCAAR